MSASCLSTSTSESERGPGRSSDRASTVIARPRAALLIGHLAPSTRTPSSPMRAVVADRDRSEPSPFSVSPHDTGAPVSVIAAIRSAMSPPATHAQTEPRKLLPWMTAAVTSRRARWRTISSGASTSPSSPPCSIGT